ncbi:MAG TPA: MBOAT family O-acyltransferase [Bacteroidia bacterium]|nr:MBOAT family O-acyltransferase [Bacteroidia bacterium]
MLFNSLIFLVFLPIVFSAYWMLPAKHRNLFLLISSYYFYFSYNPWFLILLIGTSGLDFYLAKTISNTQEQSKRKILLILSIISNIGVLFVFKYFVFFYNSGLSLFSNNPHLLSNFIIPAGLSFYTFQSISYTIDVYRNKYKADDTLKDFLLYVSFFPHMVAGPIVRHHTLMPQLKTTNFFKDIECANASKLIIWGFFKKMVIADNIALIINPVFNDLPNNFNSIEFIIIGILFLIQLYADFSGYSDIAIGVAKLFKIDLSINWKRPLLSKSVTEYWQRHHISLTSWFKEYVYISIGGNRVSAPKWVFNILIVFLLSGLWHGANFTFIIWGLLNGLFYLLEHIPNKQIKIPGIIKWMYTLFFISVFFIAFRANNIHDLAYIYQRIFIQFDFSDGINHLLALNDRLFFVVIAFVLGLLFIKELQEEYSLFKQSQFKQNFIAPTFYIIMLCLIFCLGNFNANSFIYFQF